MQPETLAALKQKIRMRLFSREEADALDALVVEVERLIAELEGLKSNPEDGAAVRESGKGKYSRYDLGLYIGPCFESEALALAETIMGLAEFTAVGGGAVGISPLTDAPMEQHSQRGSDV